jgi:hypothetical protein
MTKLDGNIIVFDTETISLNKSFIYNLGYTVVNPDGKIIAERNFIIRQIYDNKPLFATAYYANKRPIYLSYMKGRKAKKTTWGDACRLMCKDIKEYNVSDGFAFNSPFDEKAFYFNHLFFRNKRRPLDGIRVHDIMDYIGVFTETEEYKSFCKANGFVCKNGRVRRTAESCYAFITDNPDYKEEHTALEDSKIETEILMYSFEKQWELEEETEL